jgi:HemY protein
MWFLLIFILGLAIAAFGLEWLIQQPGGITLEFGGLHMEASLPVAIAGVLLTVATIIVLWAVIVAVWRLPGRVIGDSRERRRARGLDVLSQGLVAVGSGDLAKARKAAGLAQKLVPDEPLTHMLTAQAAQLGGDRLAAAKAFHKMTLQPDTKLLGLRGLHIEAKRRSDQEAAHHFAKTAHDLAPVPWAGAAILEHHAVQGDWEKARESVEASLLAKAIDLETAQKRRAVIETALAMEKERDHSHDALHLARQALKRRPGFPPAAAVATRTLIRHNDLKQALKLIESIWGKYPHPELGALYLEALSGDSNSGRLARVEKLARLAPNAPESRLLLAQAALSARDFAKARDALAPMTASGQNPTAQACLLMAEIEEAENGASGPVREWLARASRAPRDPVWLADHIASKHWLPISPATGRLDAFEWKAPPDSTPLIADESPSVLASSAKAVPGETLEISGPKP